MAPFFRFFRVRNALQVFGSMHTPEDTQIEVILADRTGHVLIARGATVPTDDEAGYAKGCLFIDTTGGEGDTVYVNEGDADDCDFNLAELSGGDITAVTAGDGLSGGGETGAVTLDVSPDDVTTEIDGDGNVVVKKSALTLGATGDFDNTTDGAEELLAASGIERAAIISVEVTEEFADGDGAQTAFAIGVTGTTDAFTDGSDLVGAQVGEKFVYSGFLDTAALLVSGTAATGTGTGAIKVTAVAAPLEADLFSE